MKKGTLVTTKNGSRGYLLRGINKRSTMAWIWDIDKHYDYMINVTEIIKK